MLDLRHSTEFSRRGRTMILLQQTLTRATRLRMFNRVSNKRHPTRTSHKDAKLRPLIAWGVLLFLFFLVELTARVQSSSFFFECKGKRINCELVQPAKKKTDVMLPKAAIWHPWFHRRRIVSVVVSRGKITINHKNKVDEIAKRVKQKKTVLNSEDRTKYRVLDNDSTFILVDRIAWNITPENSRIVREAIW